ncbi:hypothetical protein BU24DRAFT_418760 [Aaosphaeria arxii CBS 175.79]|uniref:BZIP domain-containing protein n=1 Tax=Aaosphaeria arxii CBS 175.79 TaxID=1450172 RepID=A0A6A5Y2M9_9PLEO|nr:uncharacterized protein BU24DRAFT_418760 [Aaosphaeria arxii CBS 175.79]KAF2019151.1 hypothetical protein BU24DRAFT_418760 [Aaosphaeria arxii CBS 175.79]
MSRDITKDQSIPPKKKYQRSQSPRAKERRKIQNRIAQRKHRRRLKEQSGAFDSDSYDSQDALPESGHDWRDPTPSDPVLTVEPMVPEDMSIHPTPVWGSFSSALDPAFSQMQGTPSLMHTPPMDTHFFAYPFPNCCTCSTVTGPCPAHLDDNQYQMPLGPMSDPAYEMSAFNRQLASPTPSTAKNEDLGATSINLDPHLQATNPSAHNESPSLLPSSRAFKVTKRPMKRMRSSTDPSIMLAPNSFIATSDGTRTPAKPGSPSPPRRASSGRTDYNSAESIAHNTKRFTKVLSACREAGFADLDTLMATYYGCTFETGSVADMAQRASRSRRLPLLIDKLHSSSSSWPRWEACGFRDATTDKAKKVYETEIQTLIQNVEQRTAGTTLDQIHPALQAAGANGLSKADEDLMLAQLTTLPADIGTAVQDDAPKLWSLFTELAGPQGLYCDRISQAVVALLINGRRAQWRN